MAVGVGERINWSGDRAGVLTGRESWQGGRFSYSPLHPHTSSRLNISNIYYTN